MSALPSRPEVLGRTRLLGPPGGGLQGVTHKRSDGSVVEAVRVMITAVMPQQPKASELKAGDQLLAANGNPVHSAYEWALSNFPGGWIEVLRDGKTIRIDGFDAFVAANLTRGLARAGEGRGAVRGDDLPPVFLGAARPRQRGSLARREA